MGSMKDHHFGDRLYPARPGYKVDGASKDAAKSIAPRAPTIADRVLKSLRASSKTADEIAADIDESILATRPRLSELRKKGIIERTGERRRNESGATADVWRVKE